MRIEKLQCRGTDVSRSLSKWRGQRRRSPFSPLLSVGIDASSSPVRHFPRRIATMLMPSKGSEQVVKREGRSKTSSGRCYSRRRQLSPVPASWDPIGLQARASKVKPVDWGRA